MHVSATFEPLFTVEKTLDEMFEKQAAIARMTEDEKKWPAQALSEMHKQLPFLSKYDVDIDLERSDPTSGTAFGSAMLRNKSGRVRAEEELGKPGNKVRIPIVIEKRELKAFHTFELGGTIYPLTQDRLEAAMLNPKLFDGAASPPKSPSIVDQMFPPFQQRQGHGMFRSESTGPGGIGKGASAPSGLRKHADDMMGGGAPTGMPPGMPPQMQQPQSQGQYPNAGMLPQQPGQPAPSKEQEEAAQMGPAQPAAAASEQQSMLEIPFGHEDWAEQFKGTTLYPNALDIQSKGGAQAIAKAKFTLEQQRASATQLEQQLLSAQQSQDNMAQAQQGPGEGELPEQMPPGQIPGPQDEQGQPLSFVHNGQPKAASALARALDALSKEAAGASPRTLHSGRGLPSMPGMPARSKGHEGVVAAKLKGPAELAEKSASYNWRHPLEGAAAGAISGGAAGLGSASSGDRTAGGLRGAAAGALLGAGAGHFSSGRAPWLEHAAGALGGAVLGKSAPPQAQLAYDPRDLDHLIELEAAEHYGVPSPEHLTSEDVEAYKRMAYVAPQLHREIQNGSLQEMEYTPGSEAAQYAAANPLKQASICTQVAGTLDHEDFARFNEVYDNRAWSRFVQKNAGVMSALSKLAEAPILRPEERVKIASQKAAAQRFDVIQVTPIKDGYRVKVSAAPDGMYPQMQDMDYQQAQQALPPEMMQQADQQGAATTTNVQADVDPFVETPLPVTTFGLYKVMEAGTGRQIIGYVIPTLLDPKSGQAHPQALFVNGGQFAMQPQVMGNLVALSFNLPSSPRIRGLGAFWKSDGRSIIVTTPFEVMNEVTVQGRKYYASRGADGQECQIVMVDQLKQPFAMPTGELAMPADWLFMPLDSPIQLDDGGQAQQGGQMPMKQAQARMRMTQGTIRAWDGGCDLQGPVFDKVGSGPQSWVDGVFHLACAGVPQEVAVNLLEKAASAEKALDIFGLKPLSTYVDTMAQDLVKQHQKMASRKLPRKYNLLKEAAAIPDATSVDAILSLNFVNQDNVETFLENIPRLEEASCKLASLVLASQLGLSQVPQTAAVRAMFALEDVIGSLKSLESHTV